MSVQSEIERLEAAKSGLRTAIERKGVEVSESASIDQYADLVLAISSGVSSFNGRSGAVVPQSGDYTADMVGALPLTGGTLTGNLTGKYLTGTWLQATANTHHASKQNKICVFDGSGWVYHRTLNEIFSDLGIQNAINSSIGGAISAKY